MGDIADDITADMAELYDAEYLVCCRRCGASGLHWEPISGRWRLYTDVGLHECAQADLDRQRIAMFGAPLRRFADS